jgi:signal transduction histidine kinase
VKICFIKRDRVKANVHSTAILQVLVNLFINAMHAMEGSGQIDISIVDHEGVVELRVRDYGPGVKPELLEKVLEPFFTTKGNKGTGLGLAISREIIEIDHGGEFSLQNHPHKGLEVVMRIPLGAT